MDDTIPYGIVDTDDDDQDELNQHELDIATEEMEVINDDDEESEESDSTMEVNQDLPNLEEVESGNVGDNSNEEILEPTENLPVEEHPGFSMCCDNVGKKVTTRHPTTNIKNKYINMALGYVAINRVPATHLNWQFNQDLIKAVDLSPNTFVHNNNDFEMLANRMKVIVGRIITRHVAWFKLPFTECTSPHIIHAYSAESSNRSILINSGVFDVDPSPTQEAITIYENLHRYIPSVKEKPYPSMVCGDGLSCERGNDAHKARSNGLNP